MGSGSSRSFSGYEQESAMENLDFEFYEWACAEDPDVQMFDNRLKERAARVLRALGSGVDGHFLCFDSLKEVTTSLLDMDREVMDVILKYKHDVWKNKDLFLLVEEFFDNSLATLEFCKAAEASIKTAKDNLLILNMTLKLVPSDWNPDEKEVASVLKTLDFFCQSGDPFGEDFMNKFKAVQERHMMTLIKLAMKKKKLDRRLRKVKLFDKVSSILFGSAVTAVLICSVVTAAIAAPPIAAALVAASSIPLTSLGAWMRSFWRGCQFEIKAEGHVIHGMWFATQLTIEDLENVKAQVCLIQNLLKSVATTVGFACQQNDVVALNLAIEEIHSKKISFGQYLDDLQQHVDRVGSRIQHARVTVLKRIAQRR